MSQSKFPPTSQMCQVCSKEPVSGVYNSAVSAMSFGYCRSCASSGAEPYGALITSYAMIYSLDEWSDIDQELLSQSLLVTNSREVVGKSFQDFLSDVKEAIIKEEQ